MNTNIEPLAINIIRVLSTDTVNEEKSDYPGFLLVMRL